MEKVTVNSKRWLSLENLEDERWHVIEDYPNYAISDYGRVKRLEHGTTKIDKNGVVYHVHYKEKIVRLSDSKQGYKLFRPFKDGQLCSMRVHRYVALYFVDNPHDYPIVNHKDENKWNNYYKNLEFCTYKMNSNYGTGIKRHADSIRKTRRSKVVSIDQYSTDGTFIHHYSTKGEIEDAGFLIKTILRVCQHRMETSQGFVWRFDGEPFSDPIHRSNMGGKSRKILRFNLDGTFVSQYESLHEAATELGGINKKAGITECCYGKRPHAYGSIWKYANE